MSGSRIHPDLRARFRLMPALPLRNAPTLHLTRLALKVLGGYRLPADVSRATFAVSDAVSVDVYQPAGPPNQAALLWIHGGGLVLERTGLDNRSCIETAQALGITVVSVTYRLAPEHPFPIPLQDCTAAWDWIQGSAQTLGIDPHRVAVGGQSAGGGLAAALAQLLRDRGGVQPVAQWLFCPMLDDRTAVASYPGHYALWDNKANHFGWSSYLGTRPGGPIAPRYAVPARAESLEGLPPAWIGSGDVELFHAEHLRYAEGLDRSSVPCTLDVVPGGTHAFEMLAGRTAVSRAYWARARSWLAGALEMEHDHVR